VFKKSVDKILKQIEDSKILNQIKTKKVKTDYDLILESEKLRQVKNYSDLLRSIKFFGNTLYVLSFIGLIASTGLSLAGGYKFYTGYALYAFIVAICFIQLVVFKISTLESILRTKFKTHYWSFKLVQYGLLSVSVYFNYLFFMSHGELGNRYITLLLCVLMDMSVIWFVSLAWDAKRFNFSSLDYEDTGLLRMLIFNMLFKLRLKTLKNYKTNLDLIKKEVGTQSKNLEPVLDQVKTLRQPSLEQVKNLDSKNVLKFKNKEVKILDDVKTYLFKTYTPHENIKKFQEDFGLSLSEYRNVLKVLKDENVIYTKNKNTYLHENDNNKDFSTN
jgi:hypothetical protein